MSKFEYRMKLGAFCMQSEQRKDFYSLATNWDTSPILKRNN